MAELINFNQIEALSRAIFAHLWPLTGTRASGTATVTAPAGPDVELPRNAYIRPIIDGVARDDRLYKVGPNPADAELPFTVPGDGSLSVPIVSNIGGLHQNLPADARLRFDPPQPGLDQELELDAAITNGTNLCGAIFGPFAGGPALVRRMLFWQQMREASSAADFFSAGAGEFPALLMIWTRSVPLQGRTTGGQQGTTRAQRGVRNMREGFQIFCGSGRTDGAKERRDQAMVAMQAASSLLTDCSANVDGETLSSPGGIEIVNRSLAVAGTGHFIYQLQFEANGSLEHVERRTFGPWDTNHIQILLPGHEPPEPTEDLPLVDTVDPMP